MGKSSPSSAGNASASDILNIFNQEFNKSANYVGQEKTNQANSATNLNTGGTNSPIVAAAQQGTPSAPIVGNTYGGGTVNANMNQPSNKLQNQNGAPQSAPTSEKPQQTYPMFGKQLANSPTLQSSIPKSAGANG